VIILSFRSSRSVKGSYGQNLPQANYQRSRRKVHSILMIWSSRRVRKSMPLLIGFRLLRCFCSVTTSRLIRWNDVNIDMFIVLSGNYVVEQSRSDPEKMPLECWRSSGMVIIPFPSSVKRLTWEVVSERHLSGARVRPIRSASSRNIWTSLSMSFLLLRGFFADSYLPFMGEELQYIAYHTFGTDGD
jgi:hypothetical protein